MPRRCPQLYTETPPTVLDRSASSPRGKVVATDGLVLRSLALAGEGLTLLPRWLCAEELAAGVAYLTPGAEKPSLRIIGGCGARSPLERHHAVAEAMLRALRVIAGRRSLPHLSVDHLARDVPGPLGWFERRTAAYTRMTWSQRKTVARRSAARGWSLSAGTRRIAVTSHIAAAPALAVFSNRDREFGVMRRRKTSGLAN